MCGICGIVSLAASEDLRTSLEGMLFAVRHRGTVDGTWMNGNVGLAVRRLPIIDILHSSQPLFNEDRSLVLAGNGEIFNYEELTAELSARGHRFSTHGDLECILHLYEECGNQLWNRLRGQFAVALWDVRAASLILARDHMGIKPLFYCANSSCFLFGSEMKSILAHPRFKRELNCQAIADFLSLQFVPKPQTIYKHVFMLPPASTLVLKNGRTEIRRFWDIPITSDHASPAREEVAEETGRLLRTAVQRTLISDVPVGILLSGGLDSSGIAALAAEMTSAPLKTFAIVFREKTFDESDYSRLVARALGTEHHEVVLDAGMMLESLERVADSFDEPFCEGSAFPIYHLCGYVKDHVTVLLSGEGADEIFCGYETYTAQHLARYYRLLPGPVQKLFRYAARKLPVSDDKVSLDMKIRRFVDGVRWPPPKAHFWFRTSMNDTQKRAVLKREFVAGLERVATSELYEELFATLPSQDVLNKLMVTDCRLHLPDDLLLRADTMSMAHTVEVRVPYMDIDLVSYAFSIPSKRKIRGFSNKLPLRDALRSKIPERVRTRPKKGLNMPYQKWFKQRRWRDLLHDNLQKSTLEPLGVFEPEGVQAMLREHELGLHNHAHALWTMLNLVLWMRKYRS
ncbi:MAG: asparagine synthase (glutamine-hydrolyzing) [Armatimonadetes bacterium]|nr:asparagine synthase (glutamine-hydrolyzing) [Armatimonadota bacterium]